MTRRLVGIAAGLGALALLVTGCTAPTPAVTVFSGTQSVHRDANCWTEDETVGQAVMDCIRQAISSPNPTGSPSLGVLPGNVVGISVDPAIAEAGWTLLINGQPLTSEPLTTSYYRFDFPQFAGLEGTVSLAVLADGLDPQQSRGLWTFQLVVE